MRMTNKKKKRKKKIKPNLNQHVPLKFKVKKRNLNKTKYPTKQRTKSDTQKLMNINNIATISLNTLFIGI